ncbi:MAG: DUF3106 domain-containing protein [Bryobacteraceae bacterium]|jgi:hypothetical protein
MRPLALSFGLAIAFAAAGQTAPPARAADESAATQQQPTGNPIDRWNRMSPEERERQLAKLPPERARLIRERLRQYNQLPPEEKETLRENYQRFTQLPPEKQEIVRQRMREFRELPQARRLVIRHEMEALRALPESERHARMNSEAFRTQFSPPEQQIIRDVTENVAPKR